MNAFSAKQQRRQAAGIGVTRSVQAMNQPPTRRRMARYVISDGYGPPAYFVGDAPAASTKSATAGIAVNVAGAALAGVTGGLSLVASALVTSLFTKKDCKDCSPCGPLNMTGVQMLSTADAYWYFQRNPDVAAYYQKCGSAWPASPEAYASWHFYTYTNGGDQTGKFPPREDPRGKGVAAPAPAPAGAAPNSTLTSAVLGAGVAAGLSPDAQLQAQQAQFQQQAQLFQQQAAADLQKSQLAAEMTRQQDALAAEKQRQADNAKTAADAQAAINQIAAQAAQARQETEARAALAQQNADATAQAAQDAANRQIEQARILSQNQLAATQAQVAAAQSSGNKKLLYGLAVAAAVGAGIYLFSKKRKRARA